MLDERQQAPENLGHAMSVLTSDPDRAAQLARTAMAASDPITLDIPTLTLFLSNVRDRAGDVADELFPDVLDFIASAPQPSPGRLLELGEYLFTAPQYRELPDVQQSSETYTVGSTPIANFAANRKSTNSDDIRQYIEAALKVLTATNDPYYDPVAAYAIGFQMVPKAEDIAPDTVDKLQEALGPIVELAGGNAAKVQAAIGASQAADPEGGSGHATDDHDWSAGCWLRLLRKHLPKLGTCSRAWMIRWCALRSAPSSTLQKPQRRWREKTCSGRSPLQMASVPE